MVIHRANGEGGEGRCGGEVWLDKEGLPLWASTGGAAKSADCLGLGPSFAHIAVVTRGQAGWRKYVVYSVFLSTCICCFCIVCTLETDKGAAADLIQQYLNVD